MCSDGGSLGVRVFALCEVRMSVCLELCCSGARQLPGARVGRVVHGPRRAGPAAAVGAAGGAHPRGARAPRADAERAGGRGALPRVRGHVRHVRARPVRRQGVHLSITVPLRSRSSSGASYLRTPLPRLHFTWHQHLLAHLRFHLHLHLHRRLLRASASRSPSTRWRRGWRSSPSHIPIPIPIPTHSHSMRLSLSFCVQCAQWLAMSNRVVCVLSLSALLFDHLRLQE